MPLTVGSRLGHYDVTALIGEGGMGQVYQATDTKLGRSAFVGAVIDRNRSHRETHPGRGDIMKAHTAVVAGMATLSLVCSMSAQAEIRSDIVYGHKDGMALVYDVFEPAEANGAGVVRMISGGWFSNWVAPAERMSFFEPLLAEGFTVFAVHHGSAPRFKVPDAVSDVRAALRHIRARASDYDIDPDRLGVWGGSAGGHLSLMLGLNSEGLPAAPSADRPRQGPHYQVSAADADVAAVVAYYPPVDLRGRVGPNDRFPALDFAKDQAAAISPILFVTADDPPTLLIHGDADEVVSITNSEILAASFEETGVRHEFLVIEGGNHGFRNPEHRGEATRAMVAWFKQHLSTTATH